MTVSPAASRLVLSDDFLKILLYEVEIVALRKILSRSTPLMRPPFHGRGSHSPNLARIMHHTTVFCRSCELTRADVPSGGIGVRTLVMQRVGG